MIKCNYTYNENVQRNKKLKSQIRKLGFGFWELEGHWTENKGTPDEEDVVEESLFVSLPKSDQDAEEKLKTFTLQAINHWEQDAAIIRPSAESREIFLMFKDGSMNFIGEFSPQKVNQAYSQLKKYGRTFVFETARSENWINKIKTA